MPHQYSKDKVVDILIEFEVSLYAFQITQVF